MKIKLLVLAGSVQEWAVITAGAAGVEFCPRDHPLSRFSEPLPRHCFVETLPSKRL